MAQYDDKDHWYDYLNPKKWGEDYYQYRQNLPPVNEDKWQLAREIGPLYKDLWDTRLKPAIEQAGEGFYEDVQNEGGITAALAAKLKNLKTPLPFTDANLGDAFSGIENWGRDKLYPAVQQGRTLPLNQDYFVGTGPNTNMINKYLSQTTDGSTNLPPEWENLSLDEIRNLSKNKKNIGMSDMSDIDALTYDELSQSDSGIDTPEKTGFQWPSILGGIVSSLKDSPEEAFGKNYFPTTDTGRVNYSPADSLYGDMNVSSIWGKGINTAGQKRIDKIQGTLDKWEADREKYADQLATTTLYDRLKNFKKQQGTYRGALNTATGRDPIPPSSGDGQVTSRPAWGGHGSVAAYDRSQQPTYKRAVDMHRGSAPPRGNWGAAPGTPGAWSPGARDGGRIGYAFAGPVGVEQQTDFIEGPEGGEEFQETVVEGQQQPSREQLEALAMKIFQLPLEELDEQQLVVVYQEAMQGQPMQESVQEEDVQFAANGGLAGLL